MPSALLLHPNSESPSILTFRGRSVSNSAVRRNSIIPSIWQYYGTLNFALPIADAEHDKLDRQMLN